ncbi:MAG: GGDEF domain-containing protein [Ruminococcus sp.]|nr:GGDEF domain-containing protein [Ruminococcus sp.]
MLEHNGKQNKVIAVCCAAVHKEDVNATVLALISAANAHGFKLVFLNTSVDLYKHSASNKGEASIFSLASSSIFDAVIILPEALKNDEVTEGIIAAARERGLPVISVNRRIEGCWSVEFNYADCFEDIVRHVINVHGCRRINLIAGMKDNPFSEERIERFKKELAEHGIPFEPSRLGYGDFWELPTRKVVEGWLSSGEELPEAIVCANDMMAIAACRALKEHGLRVPEDIIVTGFDGIELEKYCTPRLTTAAVDINEAGAAAMDIAQQLFDGKEPPKNTVIPYRSRISQSCGCEEGNVSAIADRVFELNNEIVRDDGHEEYMFTYLTRAIGCSDLKKLSETMRRYCDSKTWCCINTDYFSERRSKKRTAPFTEEMQLMMTTELDADRWNSSFPTEELIPDLAEQSEDSGSLMLCPLHYEAEIIGYIAFMIHPGYTVFHNTFRFVSLTKQIIESFKNRRTIARANEKLAEMHIRDPLTALLNRRGFYKHASSLIRRLNKTGGRAVIFSVDMDDLKDINDNYGHTEGDKAIKAVANALIRCADGADIVSRFGGDEFTVMSADDDGEYVESFGERVQAALDDYAKRARLDYRIRVSSGYISSRFSTVDGLDECIRLADELMYEQKRAHKSAKGELPR